MLWVHKRRRGGTLGQINTVYGFLSDRCFAARVAGSPTTLVHIGGICQETKQDCTSVLKAVLDASGLGGEARLELVYFDFRVGEGPPPTVVQVVFRRNPAPTQIQHRLKEFAAFARHQGRSSLNLTPQEILDAAGLELNATNLGVLADALAESHYLEAESGLVLEAIQFQILG